MQTKPTLLLTRPRPQSERFAAMCQEAVAAELHVVISPLLQIKPRELSLDLNGFSAVILTSANGARALAALGDVTGMAAYCVGDQTAEAAAGFGMQAHSAKGAAEDLIALIRRAVLTGPLLHARGAETRGEIAETLRADGYDVQSEVLYSQDPCDLSAEARHVLNAKKTIFAPLFSPRTAKLLSAAISGSAGEIIVFPLSDAVAEAYCGSKSQIMPPPAHPNAKALCDVIAAFYSVGSG